MQNSTPTPPPPSPPRSQASGRSGPRTRMGCLTCRRRKVRCDQSNVRVEARSRCGNCVRLELECHYAPPDAPRKPPRRGIRSESNTGTSGIPAPTATPSANHGQRCMADPTEQVDESGAAARCTYAVGVPQSIYTPLQASSCSADPMHLDRVFCDIPDFTGFSNGSDWPPVTFPAGVMSPVPGLYTSSLLPWKDFPDSIQAIGSNSHCATGGEGNNRLGSVRVDNQQEQWDRIPGSPVLHAPHSQLAPASSPSTGIDIALFDVTAHQRQLLMHFTPKANPIPLITPTDSQWKSAYSSLISMACGCTHLIDSICAVSELSLVASGKGTVAQAFTYYQSAATKAEGVLNRSSPRADDRSLKQAFATLLLLMQAEIMAQPLAGPHAWPTTHLRQAYRYLKHHSDRLRVWTGIGSHIISWIQIVDNKALYSAGMDRDSDRPSAESNTNSPCSPNATTADISPLTQPSPEANHAVHVSPVSNASTSHTCSMTSSAAPDTPADSPHDEPSSAAEIAYDALYEPVYKFFMRSQSLIPRIIALDPYHRPRGPLDDELQVLQLGQRLRGELRDLWLKRPRGLGVLSDTEGLQEVLHPRVAVKIIRGFRSFVANFHAVRIFLHRVVFIQYPASDEVKLAITEILRLAREQLADEDREAKMHDQNQRNYRGQPGNEAAERGAYDTSIPATSASTGGEEHSRGRSADTNYRDAQGNPEEGHWEDGERTSSTGPHPIMLWLWPLFMCGTECSIEDRQWVLERMYAMRSVNSERTATLLSEVTRQQDETGRRVDQRTVRKRIFDDEFDVVY